MPSINAEMVKKQLNNYLLLIGFIISLLYMVMEPIAIADDLVLAQTRPSVLFYSIFIILMTVNLPKWLNNSKDLLKPLSDYSFAIYLSHYLFIRIYRLIWPEVPVIILLVLVIASSIILEKMKLKLTEVTP